MTKRPDAQNSTIGQEKTWQGLDEEQNTPEDNYLSKEGGLAEST